MRAPEVPQPNFSNPRTESKGSLRFLLIARLAGQLWGKHGKPSAQIATSNWFPPLVYLIFNGIFAIVFVAFQILHFADNIPALCLYTIAGADILPEFSRNTEVRFSSS